MNMNERTTIAAISTAMSNSGIGIVRMSGDQAFQIADIVYRGRHGKKLMEQKSHTIHYGYIVDGEETIDEVLVMLMRGPHSYTGEDTVEINCHGGVFVVKRILELLIKSGARPAEPGEFTKKAFLNGRLDLSQAEAVGDLIASQNEYALQSSVNQLKGNIRDKISDLRNKIIYHTAFIESALDDPEHISVDGYGEELESSATEMMEEIKKLIDSADDGRVLLGEDRAIVTDIAGTTRDVLEEHITLQGISLNIMDTAGIRDTSDIVEKIGVDRARDFARDADLLIHVIDASSPLDDNDLEIFQMLHGKQSVILLNKTDLKMKVLKKDVEEAYFASNPAKCESDNATEENVSHKVNQDKTPEIIEISAKNRDGIDRLETVLKDMFFEGNLSFNNEIYITNVRQKTALKEAYDSLRKVVESIRNGMPEDFYSIDLMDAYEALGSITGETIGEDLVNEIFSKFCMGK